ncbi:MAG: monovalent cation/H+ antiporter subunit D family protein [Steroidobacteraceae bacterium]
MWQEQLPALAIAVPLAAAPLAALLRGHSASWALAALASTASLVVAVLLAIAVGELDPISYDVGSWPAPYGIELRITSFSALLLTIITASSSVALIGGKQSLDAQITPSRRPFFFAAWLLAVGGLAGIVASGDAFNIFVFMEVSSLATYVLIAGGSDPRALPAVFKYLIMGTIGATFYLIGVGLIYMMTGTLNLTDMETRIHDVSDLKPILAAVGFVTLGLVLKAGVFPLHVWLPNAYAWSPHIVTAFIAACSTKVSLYVLLRFDFMVFQGSLAGHDIQFSGFLMPLAVLAVLVASGVAMFEGNLKRLLAYSSVAQVGYIVLGASLMTVSGLTAGIVHMFNHALAKGTMFLAVACIATRLTSLRLEDLAGIGRRMPWSMAAFLLAALGLIGIPGTAGFISKWYLVLAALEAGTLGVLLVAVILISSLMAVYYVWRIVEVAWFRAPAAAGPVTREVPPMMLAILWAAALANVWFGLQPGLPLALSGAAATSLLGHLK